MKAILELDAFEVGKALADGTLAALAGSVVRPPMIRVDVVRPRAVKADNANRSRDCFMVKLTFR